MASVVVIILISLGFLIGIIIVLSLFSHLIFEGKKRKKEKELSKRHQRTSFTIKEIQDDISSYISIFKNNHPDPLPTFPFNDITDKLEQLSKNIKTSLSRLEFYRLLAPIVGEIFDEHTSIPLPEYELTQFFNENGTIFPYKVKKINEKLYVAKYREEYPEITPGLEIISINEIPSNKIISMLRQFSSGTIAEQQYGNMERDFSKLLYSVFGFSDNFDLVLSDSELKSPIHFSIQGIPFKVKEENYYSYKILDDENLLFTYNEFSGYPGKFKSFLKEMFTEVKEKKIQKIIMDVRHNQGGTSSFGDQILEYITTKEFKQFDKAVSIVTNEMKEYFLNFLPGFLRWFPIQYLHPLLKPVFTTTVGEEASMDMKLIMPNTENIYRFSGQFHILIGPEVMSATSIFTGAIKHYDIATIIGSKSGGYPTCYGNVRSFNLPNTGLEVKFPTCVIYAYGDSHIEPHYEITQTVDDLKREIDTVLEFSKNLAK
jgi:hypothetical protein